MLYKKSIIILILQMPFFIWCNPDQPDCVQTLYEAVKGNDPKQLYTAFDKCMSSLPEAINYAKNNNDHETAQQLKNIMVALNSA